ncbi:MAG: HPF/RaiA family ribosome-associated protein [Candidatus Kaiserbacteria bacterium]|nr:HPF/RaiA family ribosome-associated protein [Candidatus Kaiserbacteria bacterium]
MDTRIMATDYELTPEIRDYLDGRLQTLEKFLGDNPELARCEVELGRAAGRPKHGKNLWFAEISIVRPGRDRIYARNNAETVNAAIDDVKEEVERQLLRDRKLHRRIFRKGGAILKRVMRFGDGE